MAEIAQLAQQIVRSWMNTVPANVIKQVTPYCPHLQNIVERVLRDEGILVGERNTSSNKGGGVEMALPKEEFDLPFRTHEAQAPVQITLNGEKVQTIFSINALGLKSQVDATDHFIVQDASGVLWRVAATNITPA